MGNSRSDVQRLFGHFGLDPADYIDSFAGSASAAVANSKHTTSNSSADFGGRTTVERDLFDYRNFELAR